MANRFGNDSRIMNIRDYCMNLGGSGTATCPEIPKIAIRAGCAPSTLAMIASGHKSASAALAKRIEEATGGQVTRAELRPDLFGGLSPDSNTLEEAA